MSEPATIDAIWSVIVGCLFLLAVVLLQGFSDSPIRITAQCGFLAGAMVAAAQAVYVLVMRP
jgi:hypothetical protein